MKLRTEIAVAGELVAGAGVSAVLAFAYMAIVARKLGPAAYGDVSSAISFVYVATVATSPIAPAVSRVVARMTLRGDDTPVAALREWMLRRFTIVAAIGLLIAIAVAVPLANVFHFESGATVFLAFASATAYLFVSTDRAFLHGRGRFRAHTVSSIVEAAVRLAFGIALLMIARRADVALIAYVLGPLLAEVMLLIKEHRGVPAAKPEEWDEIVRLARPLLLLMVGAAIFQNADMLAVKRWLPADLAGQYGAAAALTRSFGVLFVPLYILSGPLLVGLHDAGRSIAGATARLCGYFVALSAIPLLVLIFGGRQLMTFLYGAAYADAAPLAAALGGAVVIGYLALLIAQAQATIGHFFVARIFLGFAVVQVLALLMFHGSAMTIIATLYVVQGALLVVIAATLFGRRMPAL